jgi:hypothetical protein
MECISYLSQPKDRLLFPALEEKREILKNRKRQHERLVKHWSNKFGPSNRQHFVVLMNCEKCKIRIETIPKRMHYTPEYCFFPYFPFLEKY